MNGTNRSVIGTGTENINNKMPSNALKLSVVKKAKKVRKTVSVTLIHEPFVETYSETIAIEALLALCTTSGASK